MDAGELGRLAHALERERDRGRVERLPREVVGGGGHGHVADALVGHRLAGRLVHQLLVVRVRAAEVAVQGGDLLDADLLVGRGRRPWPCAAGRTRWRGPSCRWRTPSAPRRACPEPRAGRRARRSPPAWPVISSSLSMSSERESRVGSFMMVETCLPRTTESSMAAPTPSKYVRYVSTLRLCWQLRAHQAMPNTTTKRTAARMAMRWMRVRRRSGRRRDEGAEGGPPASAGARLVSSSKKSTPRTPRF